MVVSDGFAPDLTGAATHAPMGAPRPTLKARDVLAITVGIVVGAGIFRTPSLVASEAGSEAAMLLGFPLKYDVVDLVGTQVSIAAKLPRAALAKLTKS